MIRYSKETLLVALTRVLASGLQGELADADAVLLALATILDGALGANVELGVVNIVEQTPSQLTGPHLARILKAGERGA